MSNKNGLLCPLPTHGNPQISYYLQKGEPIPTDTTIVAPIILASEDGVANAFIGKQGLEAGVPGPYTGSISLDPGSSSAGLAPGGVNIRSIANGVAVEVGVNASTANHLYIAGPSGISEVYDYEYNPPILPTPVAGITGSIPANTGPGLFTFTPTRTGAYMLQVNINVQNTDSIPIDGSIEWVLNVGGGEVQYVSNTIKSTSMTKANSYNEINGLPGVLAPPMDFTFTDMAILTAGQQVSFYLACARNSAAGGGAWAIANYQVRLIQMC